jgi:hypothetical protein
MVNLFVYGPLADTLFLDFLLREKGFHDSIFTTPKDIILTTALIKGFACKICSEYPVLVPTQALDLQMIEGFSVKLDDTQMRYVEEFAATTFKLRPWDCEIEVPKTVNCYGQKTVVKLAGKMLIWPGGDEYSVLTNGELDERKWPDELRPALMELISAWRQ